MKSPRHPRAIEPILGDLSVAIRDRPGVRDAEKSISVLIDERRPRSIVVADSIPLRESAGNFPKVRKPGIGGQLAGTIRGILFGMAVGSFYVD